MSTCGTCGAEITWAMTERGARMPLDPMPTPRGNVVYNDDGTVRILGAATSTALPRFLPHWATCPAPPPRRKR